MEEKSIEQGRGRDERLHDQKMNVKYVKVPNVPELALMVNDSSCNTGSDNEMSPTQFINFQ